MSIPLSSVRVPDDIKQALGQFREPKVSQDLKAAVAGFFDGAEAKAFFEVDPETTTRALRRYIHSVSAERRTDIDLKTAANGIAVTKVIRKPLKETEAGT